MSHPTAFGVLRSIPSKVFAGVGLVIGVWSALWPDSARDWLNWAWHTRLVGIAILGLVALWCLAYWWFGKHLSPIRVRNALFIDCDPVGHTLGGPALELYSAAYSIEVENVAKDHKTVKGLKAICRDQWGEEAILHIRGSASGEIDLQPGEKAWIEVARIAMQMEPGHVPGIERGQGYWVLSPGEINEAYNQEKTIERLQISSPNADAYGHVKGQPPFQIKVLVTAVDTLPKMVVIEADLWAVNSRDRLKIKSIGRPK
jgi:hypothetical protein